MLLVKKSRMGIHNLVTSEEEKYKGLLRKSFKLIGTVMGKMAFSTPDLIQVVKEERWGRGGNQYVANDGKLWIIVSNQGAFEKQLFLCTELTGSWMGALGTTETGTVLSATKFRGFYVLVITLTLLTFKRKTIVACILFLRHILSCSNRGLVIASHNRICDFII